MKEKIREAERLALTLSSIALIAQDSAEIGNLNPSTYADAFEFVKDTATKIFDLLDEAESTEVVGCE